MIYYDSINTKTVYVYYEFYVLCVLYTSNMYECILMNSPMLFLLNMVRFAFSFSVYLIFFSFFLYQSWLKACHTNLEPWIERKKIKWKKPWE